MNARSNILPATITLLGLGAIGRHTCLSLAKVHGLRHVRLIDRDVYEKHQLPAHAGRPKAVVVAEMMRAVNRKLQIEAIVGDIENLPLGLFRSDVQLTALDSKRARIRANYAFCKLAIRYWIDAGISAPFLARVSVFEHGQDAPCYECGLDDSDYAANTTYACQPASAPPPTKSPEYLGACAASLQVGELAKILSGDRDKVLRNRELVYDFDSHRSFITQLARQPACRMDHRPLSIKKLRQNPRELCLRDLFGLRTAKRHAGACVCVPEKMFMRGLRCNCGRSRSILRLKDRFQNGYPVCRHCGQPMFTVGNQLSNAIAVEELALRDQVKRLSSLGFQPGDVIALSRGRRTEYFELGN